ncbi:GTP-binding protein 6 [Pyrus ussuriensis x Pyrus communis]|uniref:GTP-binding protein 6 n=1 Tax=Pyrus ussuriensis x Pyrus communis TaxID=2448454 RepID=A0A5N5HJY9_9ROSA|nr:GTP-binding protein 6 [Pyrus ussuriensis x Pyrus communis]
MNNRFKKCTVIDITVYIELTRPTNQSNACRLHNHKCRSPQSHETPSFSKKIKAYIVGVEHKRNTADLFGVEESLKESTQLADTAGLMVVGSTHKKLVSPNSRTYIGSGKVAEIKSKINASGAFGGEVRVCDFTALVLDSLTSGLQHMKQLYRQFIIVASAQMEYQLPRQTKVWTQDGREQIEVDKRILRTQQYRNQRLSVPVPVVSLVTTLDPIPGFQGLHEFGLHAIICATFLPFGCKTYACFVFFRTKNGKEFLLTDTVGFIQKLPTTVFAAFRATLEEISESSLLVHVVDICNPLAEQQIDVSAIPKLMVWNKFSDPERIKLEAERRDDVLCISALSGEGVTEFCGSGEIEGTSACFTDSMVWVGALIPFEKGELLSTIQRNASNSNYHERKSEFRQQIRKFSLLLFVCQLSISSSIHSAICFMLSY